MILELHKNMFQIALYLHLFKFSLFFNPYFFPCVLFPATFPHFIYIFTNCLLRICFQYVTMSILKNALLFSFIYVFTYYLLSSIFSMLRCHNPKECFPHFIYILTNCGARGSAVVEILRYKPEGRGIESRWFHWNFSLTYSFRPHYGPGGDSGSNRNEYREYFLGVKAVGA
jgi:hypothetical protein